MSVRIDELSALTQVASDDVFPVVDVSDSTDSTAGTTRKLTYANCFTYGQISAEGNSTATSISGSQTDFGANAVQVVVFDTNGPSNGTTPDHTNDHITIDIAGDYLITAHVSFSGQPSDTYSFALFKNNKGTQLGVRFTRKLGTGGDVGSATISTFASGLAANDTIELWCQNEDGSATFDCTVQDVVLSVLRVG